MLHQGAASVAVRVLGNMWDTAFTDHRLDVAQLIREYVQASKMPDHSTIARQIPDRTAEIQAAITYVEDPAVIENRAEQLLFAAKRRLLANTAETCERASGGNIDVDIAINQTFGELANIYSGGVKIDTADWSEKLLEDYDRREAQGLELTGAPTGLPKIDQATSGLQYGETHVLAARTGHGKSAMAVNYIAPAAARPPYEVPVLVIGHEMSSRQYRLRMACADAGVHYSIASAARLRLKTKERLQESIKKLSQLPISIIEPQTGDPTELMAHVMAWRHSVGRQGLVIVDHLQNEAITGFRGQRPEMFAQISAQWKACMQATDCAGLLIAQLNRAAAGQPPKLENLRDSGAIEQDAMSVMLLYRAGQEDPEKPANCAQVGLAKNREGSLAYEHMSFEGYCMHFRPWKPDDSERTATEMQQSEKNIHENQKKPEE